MRAKVKERRQENINGQRVTVQVLEPKETKPIPSYMASRDDSTSPGQNFMRMTKGRW
jgi:hypothetical protein